MRTQQVVTNCYWTPIPKFFFETLLFLAHHIFSVTQKYNSQKFGTSCRARIFFLSKTTPPYCTAHKNDEALMRSFYKSLLRNSYWLQKSRLRSIFISNSCYVYVLYITCHQLHTCLEAAVYAVYSNTVQLHQ